MMKTLTKLLSIVLLLTAGALCQQISVPITAADAGTCNATTSACAWFPLSSSPTSPSTTIVVQVTGNAGANTLLFEVSADNVTWKARLGTPSDSSTQASSTTSTGAWQINVAGYSYVRVRCSVYNSGTTTVIMGPPTSGVSGVGGGGGSGSGTVNAGTTGQIGYYAGNGTTISGTSTLPSSVTMNVQFPVTLFNSVGQGAAGSSINCNFPAANAPGSALYAGTATTPQVSYATFPAASFGTQYIECRYLLPPDFKSNTIASITALVHVDTDTTNTHTIIPATKWGCDGADGSLIYPTYGAEQVMGTVTISTTINQKFTSTLATPTLTCAANQTAWVRFYIKSTSTVNSGNVGLDALQMMIVRAMVTQ